MWSAAIFSRRGPAPSWLTPRTLSPILQAGEPDF